MANLSRRQVCGMLGVLPFAMHFGASCGPERSLRTFDESKNSEIPDDVRVLIDYCPRAQVEILTTLSELGMLRLDQLRDVAPHYLLSHSLRTYPREYRSDTFKGELGLTNQDKSEKVIWWVESNNKFNQGLGVIYGNTESVTAVRFMFDTFDFQTIQPVAKMRADVVQTKRATINQWNNVLNQPYSVFHQAESSIEVGALGRLVNLLTAQPPALFEDVQAQRQIGMLFRGS